MGQCRFNRLGGRLRFIVSSLCTTYSQTKSARVACGGDNGRLMHNRSAEIFRIHLARARLPIRPQRDDAFLTLPPGGITGLVTIAKARALRVLYRLVERGKAAPRFDAVALGLEADYPGRGSWS